MQRAVFTLCFPWHCMSQDPGMPGLETIRGATQYVGILCEAIHNRIDFISLFLTKLNCSI